MRNRRRFIFVATLTITLLSGLSSESKSVQGTIHGTLSDSMCKMDHKAMIKMGSYGTNSVSCTQKCLKEGNKLIFIDKKTKAVYTLQNPGSAKKFAGKNVSITGHIDNTTKVIHVHSVKLSS